MSPTITVTIFWTRKVHFSVHLFNNINLNYGRPKQTRNATSSSNTNKNIDVHNLENILRITLWCFSLGFFSALCDFFLKIFGLHQRVSPSFVSIGSHFFPKSQNSFLKFLFGNFLNLPRVPFQLFSLFATNSSFTKHKGSYRSLLQF